MYGKFFNAGQTCVATDYILADESIYEQLLIAIKRHLNDFFTDSPKESKDLAHY